MLTENPEATHSISIWHTPLVWLLASTLFYLVLYAVGILRSGKVEERAIPFSFSAAGAVLLVLAWPIPMLAGLMQFFGGTGC